MKRAFSILRAQGYQGLVILCIVALGFGLRFHNYATFPSVEATADEWAWTWLGASLLSEGVPTSWSLFYGYDAENRVILPENPTQTLVRPALDHPPLFSLIPGAVHLLSGREVLAMPSQTAIRFPMVLLGTFNVLLFTLIAMRMKGSRTAATLASLWYASAPLVVIGSRLVVADNLLATLVLILLWLAITKRLRPTHELLLAFVAALIKIQGLFIGIGFGLYAVVQNKYRHAALLGGAITAALLVFGVYGAYFDWQLFTSIFAEQAGRATGYTTILHRFFFHPSLAAQPWPTALKPVLFVTTIGAILTHPKSEFWKRAGSLFLTFIALSLMSVDEFNINGWYEFTLYPILFLSLVPSLNLLLDHLPKLGPWLVWLVLGVPYIKMIATNLGVLEALPDYFLELCVILGALTLLAKTQQHIRRATIALIVILIGLQAISSWTLTAQSYRHQVFIMQLYLRNGTFCSTIP